MTVDIHSHLLPGIDDGAGDLEEAVTLCRQAAEDGCRDLIATPHQRHAAWPNDDPQELERLLRRLREAVGDRPRLHLGAEIRIDAGLLNALDRYPKSGLTPLAGSRYLLLEFARDSRGEIDPVELTHELAVAGWRPIFAHPEMVPLLAGDLDRMAEMIELGGLFQLTAMSVTGGFGARIQRRCRRMLDRGLIHFLASDAHDPWRRPAGLRRATLELAARWGDPAARALTVDNPRAVLENRPVEVRVPARP